MSHTEEFANALLAKMGAAGESDEIYGGFMDIIMELIMELFSDCPASRLKRAARGRWVPGYFMKKNQLTNRLNEQFSGGRFSTDSVITNLKEVCYESSIETIQGVLDECKED